MYYAAQSAPNQPGHREGFSDGVSATTSCAQHVHSRSDELGQGCLHLDLQQPRQQAAL